MKKFKDYLVEQGFFNNVINSAKNFLKPKDPNVPNNGDKLKIFNLYKGNGTYLVSSIDDGILRIGKDGSVNVQWDNNSVSKIANSIDQAKLEPNGLRSWKINRKLD